MFFFSRREKIKKQKKNSQYNRPEEKHLLMHRPRVVSRWAEGGSTVRVGRTDANSESILD